MAEEVRVAVYVFEAVVLGLSAVSAAADRDWQHQTRL